MLRVKDPKSIRAFLDSIAPSLSIQKGDFNAWYRVTIPELVKLGARELLEEKKYNIRDVLKVAYPEHNWNKLLFVDRNRRIPTNRFLTEIRNHLINVGESLGIKDGDYEAWYSVPYGTLAEFYGMERYLRNFENSRFGLFSAAFPEHKWHPWLFKNFVKLNDIDGSMNKKDFAGYLEEKLGIKTPSDWNSVTRLDLVRVGLPPLVKNQSELLQFLRAVYPDVQYDPGNMRWSSLGFSHLYACLTQFFPNGVSYSKDYFPEGAGETISLFDRILVIPKSKLIIEYQGPIVYAKQLLQSEETLVKFDSSTLLSLAKKTGFTPVSIPFWWNRQRSSLLAELHGIRPDLFEATSGHLFQYKEDISEVPIRTSVPLKEVDIYHGNIQKWLHDPRFEYLLANMKPRKRGRKPKIAVDDEGKPLPKPKRKRVYKTPRVKPNKSQKYEKFTEKQTEYLLRVFEKEPQPGEEHRAQIAKELGLPIERITGWFYFKRNKLKEREKAQKKLERDKGAVENPSWPLLE